MGCKLYSDITCSSPIVQSLLRNAHVKHHTFLKLTYSNYQIIKISENCFQNMKFFPNQTNFSSGPSQILILQHPIPISSLLLSPSLSNFALVKLKPFMLFFGRTASSYPIQPHAYKYWICKILYQAKPIKSIIMPYTDHKTL